MKSSKILDHGLGMGGYGDKGHFKKGEGKGKSVATTALIAEKLLWYLTVGIKRVSSSNTSRRGLTVHRLTAAQNIGICAGVAALNNYLVLCWNTL